MARFVPNFDTIEAVISSPTEAAAAKSVAEEARKGAAMHELKSGPESYKATKTEDGWTAGSPYSLAHIDEFGGAKVRSTPTGALRTAAARHGRFEPK